MPAEPSRSALVLSGGGADGAFEAGVIAALADQGIHPTVLAGTSAGALNAAAVAVGLDADAIIELWSSLESRDVYRPRLDLHRFLRPLHLLDPRKLARVAGDPTLTDHVLDGIGWTWLLDPSPLRDRIVDAFGGEVLPLRDDVTLTVPAVDLTTGRLVRFTNRRPRPGRDGERTIVTELTVDHLLASAAIPLLFRPPRVDGELYWDGGLVANTPLRAALQHEPDTAFVVATGAVEQQSHEPDRLGRTLGLAVDHLLRYALLEDLDHARTVNQLVRHAPEATKHKLVDFVVVAPERRAGGGLGHLLDFEPSRARDLIEHGRTVTEGVLERWQAGELVDAPES